MEQRPAAGLQRLYLLPDTRAWVAESAAEAYRRTAAWPPQTVPEKLVRCLWFEARWRPAVLHTLRGEAVVVHSPGRWNTQAGPDFRHAVLELAGRGRCRGDVEVHCYASGWTAHHHHTDPRYANVILHVFLWNDRAEQEARRADGRLVPQVALAPQLPQPLSAYQAAIALEEYPARHVPRPGRCYEALRRLPHHEVAQFLARAGDLRLWQRAWRWQPRAREVALSQVLYEAVMRALGVAGHRHAFQALAARVPWAEVQGCLQAVPAAARAITAEALLLGLAGLLPPAALAADSETRRYVAALHESWRRIPPAIRQRAWQGMSWRQPHGRPSNTPWRRLAAMAQLLARYHTTDLLALSVPLCRAAAGASRGLAGCRALTAMLSFPVESYWTRRLRLGGARGSAQRLLGRERALTVVVDALLPVLLLHAQHQADEVLSEGVWACYHAAPRLPDNHLLRYMRRRLLGDEPALLALVRGARQQQGLLQIFHDFCGNDEGDCQGCEFPLLAARS